MARPTLTDEEHEARAMLLGAKWKSYIHCYVWEGEKPERWIDDESLEELTHDQKFQRLSRSLDFK